MYNDISNEAGRQLVDELFNCEDVLMNFIATSANLSGPPIRFLRPTVRIDLSFTSGAIRTCTAVVACAPCAVQVRVAHLDCCD